MTKPDRKVALKDYEMTPEELFEFINGDPPKFASVGSLRKTGSPIIDGVGIEWDGECAYFSVRNTRAIMQRIKRDDRICLHMMNAAYPVRWVRLEGHAEVIEDPGYEYALRIMHKYMAPDSPAQELKDFDLEHFDRAYVEYGRTLIRLRPTYIHSHDARKQASEYELTTGRRLPAD